MTQADVTPLSAAFCAIGWNKPEALFTKYLNQQESGLRLCFVGEVDGELAGYVTLSLASRYSPYRSAGIPEVSDLNVVPTVRRRGLGSALMDAVESAAREHGASVVGLGVGLYDDYGSAQRLYVRRGYLPDGRGVMYDYEPVRPGGSIRLDDDAILMMTKPLSN